MLIYFTAFFIFAAIVGFFWQILKGIICLLLMRRERKRLLNPKMTQF